MRFINFLTESLNFVDLPELNKKFRNRFKCSLTDCNANMKYSGGEIKFSVNELKILKIDIEDLKRFFDANGWENCSNKTDELIFRQAREATDNIKPYYELDMAKNNDYQQLYRELLKVLNVNSYYHISTVSPEQLFSTNGLRCKNNSNVKFSKRIYMVSSKMALKTCILDGSIDDTMDKIEAQEALNNRLYDCADQMVLNIQCEWENDHSTKNVPVLYMYKIELPKNWPVYKDPEFNDDDEFSACACFTNQNIPVKFIKLEKEITDSYI